MTSIPPPDERPDSVVRKTDVSSAQRLLDRRALQSVAVQFFINGAVFASFVPRLPEIRDRADITVGELGLLISIGGGIGLSGSLGSPWVISRFGTRRALIVGAGILIAFLPLLGFANSILLLVVAFAGLQTFDVLVDVAMNFQGSWISARRHAPVMNRLHGLWSLGTVVGGLVAAQLAQLGLPLEAHFVGVAALMLAALIFVGRGLLREDETFDSVGAKEKSEPGAGGFGSKEGSRFGFALAFFALAGAGAIVIEIVSSDWAAFRLKDDFNTSLGVAGLGYVAFTVGMTTGRFSGDSVQLRIGSQRMFRLAVLISGIGLVGASIAPNPWLTLAGYVVAGLGVSTFFPKLYDDAAKHPGRKGAGMGALTGGSRTAGLLAPAAVGALANTSLSVGQATLIVTVPSLLLLTAVSLRPSP